MRRCGVRDRVRRLIALTRMVTRPPGAMPSLSGMADALHVAKSTLSEDLALVREVLLEAGLGEIHTQVGVGGGVRFVERLDVDRVRDALEVFVRALDEPDRVTGPGFLYMTDLLFRPELVEPLGALLAERLGDRGAGLVATVETKGIPLALAVSRALSIPVVLIRRDNRLSEGSSLSINYLSGSSHRIQSMSLARRAPVRGARVLFVDDFLKAGGTARAASDLLREFEAEVVGVGVLVATASPAAKLVADVAACLRWQADAVTPTPWVLERLAARAVPGDCPGAP